MTSKTNKKRQKSRYSHGGTCRKDQRQLLQFNWLIEFRWKKKTSLCDLLGMHDDYKRIVQAFQSSLIEIGVH